jgi:hypothetical protein
MTEITYSQAVTRLIEFRTVTSERDQRIWDAHVAHVSKAEAARLTGLSWQTIDRVVRDMEAKTSSEENGQ